MAASIRQMVDLGAYGELTLDGIALLPGWEQSKGACLERVVAEACGIPCKTVGEWLEDAR